MVAKKEYAHRGEFVPEEGDSLRFKEHPELEAQVKERIAEVIENRGGRPVVTTDEAVKYLRKTVGLDLGSVLCSVEEKTLSSFIRKNSKVKPTPLQTRN